MSPIDEAANAPNPERVLEKAPGYDDWLFEKVTRTLRRVADKATPVYDHADAMASLKARAAALRSQNDAQ